MNKCLDNRNPEPQRPLVDARPAEADHERARELPNGWIKQSLLECTTVSPSAFRPTKTAMPRPLSLRVRATCTSCCKLARCRGGFDRWSCWPDVFRVNMR